MTINYDTVADAVYVSITSEAVAKTIKVTDRLVMDVDASGNTVGLEILNASSQEELIGNIQKGVAEGIPVSIHSSTPALA